MTLQGGPNEARRAEYVKAEAAAIRKYEEATEAARATIKAARDVLDAEIEAARRTFLS